MRPEAFCALAERLLRQPTAPYFEHLVRAEAERICGEEGLDCERDRFGNLHVKLNTRPGTRPLVLAAHMDHPGFEILRQNKPGEWLARFRGGVAEAYFRPGTPVRLLPGSVRGVVHAAASGSAKEYLIRAKTTNGEPFTYAVWDLKPFALRRGRIYARGCDDVVGVAAVLRTMIELKRARARVHVVGVLSRAEEVGFHGALALASASKERARSAAGGRGGPLLPADGLIISLETSRELPGARMGEGVIIRVGDKASVFDSRATRYLSETAAEIRASDPGFRYQRALMSGGTCEATAYQEYGFVSGAVCVALGNYHNCGSNERIRSEFVDLRDACAMVQLLVGAARNMPRFESLTGKLPRVLQKLERVATRELQRRP